MSSNDTPKSCRLEGKVALITGGASGIGESTARLFLKQGAKVIIADIQDNLGHSLCQELNSNDETLCYVHCDVTCDSDVQNAMDFAVSKYGKLDIVFSNAGVAGSFESVIDIKNEDFKRIFDVNVFGTFLVAKHAARIMIPAKKGSIIFTSSNLSVTCFKGMHPYAASKHAVVGLAKNLSIELGQYGIRVNCVSPFAVVTPLFRQSTGIFEMEKAKIEEMTSESGNLKNADMEVEDVAQAVLYLGSDESKYVSGLNLVIDGGYGLTNPSFQWVMEGLISSS